MGKREAIERIGETLMQGSIDRLVTMSRDSRVIAADIIDYKSDHVSDDPAEYGQLLAGYTPQLNAYRFAVCQMFDLPVERVSARLALVRAGVVFDVPLHDD